MLRNVIRSLIRMVRPTPETAKIEGKGYYVTLNGANLRWEPNWKSAFKHMRRIQRKRTGMRVEMRRVLPIAQTLTQ